MRSKARHDGARGSRTPQSALRRGGTLDWRKEKERQTQENFDTAMQKLQEVDRLLEQSRINGDGAAEDNLVQEWLELVASLIDTFRTTKALFPSDGVSHYCRI